MDSNEYTTLAAVTADHRNQQALKREERNVEDKRLQDEHTHEHKELLRK
jgi:hypothetical protein